MERYKRLMVGLELVDADKTTLPYAAKVTRMARAERIHFVHVTPTHDIPESVSSTFPDLLKADESVLDLIKRMVKTHYKDADPGTAVEFEVVEGNAMGQLLKKSKELSLDLVIIGRQRDDVHDVLPENVVRKAPCSVLVIPEGASTHVSTILVPVDFSDCAREASEVAIAFACADPNEVKVKLLHVFDVPTGYYKTGKSYEEFAEIMEGHAQEHYEQFIGGIDTRGISVTPVFIRNSHVEKTILRHINRQKADLLITGARGRTAASAMLLGSTTERLIRKPKIPMVVVKRKGRTLGLIDALLRI